jgi:hypothetical protein
MVPRRPALLLLALIACKSEGGAPTAPRAAATPPPQPPAPTAPEPQPEPAELRCERLAFAAELPIAEASGATLLSIDGHDRLLVVGDSGTHGAYLLLDPEDGTVLERGALPLGEGAGDDLEGVAVEGDRIVGVTSAGWLRAWRRVAGGFALIDGPYPVAKVDPRLPARPKLGGLGATPTDSMACAAHGVNCGKNYEGLCLTPGDGPCAGWLAAKADGHLWCLARDGDRLRADRTHSIAVTTPDVLSGCAHEPASDALWLATNGFDGAVYRVTGWRVPAEARVERIELPGGLFPEAIAVRGEVIWRFDDLSQPPSPAGRWRCR